MGCDRIAVVSPPATHNLHLTIVLLCGLEATDDGEVVLADGARLRDRVSDGNVADLVFP